MQEYRYRVIFQGNDIGIFVRPALSFEKGLRDLKRFLLTLNVGKERDFIVTGE